MMLNLSSCLCVHLRKSLAMQQSHTASSKKPTSNDNAERILIVERLAYTGKGRTAESLKKRKTHTQKKSMHKKNTMSVQDNLHCLMLCFIAEFFLIMTSVLSYCTINITNEYSPCYWLSHIFDTVPKRQTSTHFSQSINLINAHFIHRRTQKT